MHDRLSKILGKKRNLSDNERTAKLDVVKNLRDMASEEMGGKLKQVVSGSEEAQMRRDAEAPYSDYKHACEEHEGEEVNNELGEPVENEAAYAEGGEVEESPDDDPQEFEGLDLDQINQKLEKLLQHKQELEAKQS